MKLHYAGKYNLDEESLPGRPHEPGAVPFREMDMKTFSIVINIVSCIVTIILFAFVLIREYVMTGEVAVIRIYLGIVLALLSLIPHEILHAICFREDVYLYTNFKQGMLFVVGTETMSKGRFIFMSLLPNIVFGLIPFVVGIIFPQLITCITLGAFALGMGAGDYYNVLNAVTQMPKGARTYLHKFHSYWYMP